MEQKREDETVGGQKAAFFVPKKVFKKVLPDIGVEERVGSSVGAVLTKSRAIQGWVWCHKTKGQSDS